MRGDVEFDDDAQHVLAVLPAVAGADERELPGHQGLRRPDAVKEKWIHPPSGENAQSLGGSTLFIVDPEGHGLAARGGAGAFLFERRATLGFDRARETAANGVLLLADGERGRGIARDRDRPESESVVHRVGKQRGWFCARKHVEHQHQKPGLFRTGEGVDVGDVHDGIC